MAKIALSQWVLQNRKKYFACFNPPTQHDFRHSVNKPSKIAFLRKYHIWVVWSASDWHKNLPLKVLTIPRSAQLYSIGYGLMSARKLGWVGGGYSIGKRDRLMQSLCLATSGQSFKNFTSVNYDCKQNKPAWKHSRCTEACLDWQLQLNFLLS